MSARKDEAQATPQAPPDALRRALQRPVAERVARRISTEGRGAVADPIIGRDATLHYYVLDVTGLPPANAMGARLGLADEGYNPITGPYYDGPPRAESVIDRPGAELWAMPLADYRQLELSRRQQAINSRIHRQIDAGRQLERPDRE